MPKPWDDTDQWPWAHLLPLLPGPRCSCPAGFEGPTCGVNTDDCVEHACANGGVCVDGLGNYTCQCPLQYAGMWGSHVCGEVRAGLHALNPVPVTVGALPPRQQEASAGRLPGRVRSGRSSFSPASLWFFLQEGPVSSWWTSAPRT